MFKWLFAFTASAVIAVLAVPTDASAYAFAAARGSNGEVYEWCTKSTLAAAKSCAEDRCEASDGDSCRIVTTCSNGMWSGVAEVKFVGNIRRHGSGCGFRTLSAVKSKMVSECGRVRKSIKPKATNCAATIIDPEQDDTPNKYKWIWKNGVLKAQ